MSRQVPWAASHVEHSHWRARPAGDRMKEEFRKVSTKVGLRASGELTSVVTRAELKDKPLQKVRRGLPGWGKDRNNSFAEALPSSHFDILRR